MSAWSKLAFGGNYAYEDICTKGLYATHMLPYIENKLHEVRTSSYS